MRFGLIGPSYIAQSSNFSRESAVNLYCEPIESPNPGKGGSKMMMVKIPGLAVTHELPDSPLRCLYSGDGLRVFAVSGATLYELFADGTYTALGAVERATSPAQIFSNGTQLFVVSGSSGYIADGTSVEHVVDCCQGGYIDGYFLALDGARPGESKTFRISALLDGKRWDALEFANVDQTPDNVQAMFVDHRQVLFLKQQTAETYWDSGDVDFPITPVQGSMAEQGTIAPWSPQRIDNTVMFLGGDERGAGVVWRMQGYTPVRVSNYAVENMIQDITRAGLPINDAVGMSDQQQGHAFYHLSFPSANLTLTYDCSTGLWHRRASWYAIPGEWRCHKARYHCYALGKHYVGGGDGTGTVYQQSTAFQDDAGEVLRWVRVTPTLADASNKKLFFSNMFLDFQVGVGTDTLLDGDGNPRQPQIIVRYSNDGGNTWGAEQLLALGKIGEYSQRVRQLLCGSARSRVIEISGSDPVQIAIAEGTIEAELGVS